MWILERKKDKKIVHILCNKEYTFGRKNSTVLVPEDPSVSRSHLIIRVDFLAENVSGRPPLKIKDLGSTYGTYVNPISNKEDGKIEPNTWVNVEKDSIMHFGLNNVWSIKWLDITILCSAMAPAGRKRLSAQLTKLGARQIADWNDRVTHLVMEKVVFTQKVMQCLIAGKPILNVEYFEAWTEKLENDPSVQAPNIADHVPQIDPQLAHIERMLFLPRTERRTIFQGMVFIFPSTEQYESMAKSVSSAGGVPVQTYDNEEAILIEHIGSTPPMNYMLMFNLQKQQGRRVIPIKEIGLAVLNCSIERYCNQLFKLEQTLFKNIPAQSSKSSSKNPGAVLAPETQASASTTQDVLSKRQKVKVVPDSPVKGPASKRICLENKEKSIDTTEQDEETQLVARKSDIFRLNCSSFIPDTPDGAALGKPTKTPLQDSPLPPKSRPGPLSKKLQNYSSVSEAPVREKDELISSEKPPSPSPESVKKSKPCPLSKKSFNSPSPDGEVTCKSPRNVPALKPGPLSKKLSNMSSPEDQTTSRSTVPVMKPGPLSKKMAISRGAEEVQLTSTNSESVPAGKPGPLSKKMDVFRVAERDASASANTENVAAGKPSPLSKKLGITRGTEEKKMTSSNPGHANISKPGPLSKKLGQSQVQEGNRAEPVSPVNVSSPGPGPLSKKPANHRNEEEEAEPFAANPDNFLVAKPGPRSKKIASHQCEEDESRTANPENVPAAKRGPLSKKLSCRSGVESQFLAASPKSPVSAVKHGTLPTEAGCSSETDEVNMMFVNTENSDSTNAGTLLQKVTSLAVTKATGKASSSSGNIKRKLKNGALESSTCAPTELRKAQKSSRSTNNSPESSPGPFPKKIALESTSTIPVAVTHGRKSRFTALSKIPDYQGTEFQAVKGMKRPASPIASEMTPNAKKTSITSPSFESPTSPDQIRVKQVHGTSRKSNLSSSHASGCFKEKTNTSRRGQNTSLWEQAKEHSTPCESMNKLAVRGKLFRTDRTVTSDTVNRTISTQCAGVNKVIERVRNFREVYFKDGKWVKSVKFEC